MKETVSYYQKKVQRDNQNWLRYGSIEVTSQWDGISRLKKLKTEPQLGID